MRSKVCASRTWRAALGAAAAARRAALQFLEGAVEAELDLVAAGGVDVVAATCGILDIALDARELLQRVHFLARGFGEVVAQHLQLLAGHGEDQVGLLDEVAV